MAIKIKGSTIINDNRQIVDVDSLIVSSVDPTSIVPFNQSKYYNSIDTFSTDAVAESGRTPGNYTSSVDINGAVFTILVADIGGGIGGEVSVTLLESGSNYQINDTIVIPSIDIGGGSDITVTVLSTVNPLKYIGSEESSPEDIAFSNDGTKMYVVGSSGDDITPYTLTTPWKVNTATYISGEEFPGGIGDIRGITWSSNGLNLYLTSSNSVHQYITTNPFSVSGLSKVSEFSVNSQTSTNAQSIRFSPDGTKFYVSSSGGDEIFQYICIIPWDIKTASYSNIFYDFTADEATPTGFDFSTDGTKLLLTGHSGRDITYYKLSTPWDISSASLVQVILTLEETLPQGLFWRVDGRKVYIVGSTNDTVYEFDIPQTSEVEIISQTGFYDHVEFYENVEFYDDVETYGDLSVRGTLSLGDDNPGAKLTINGVSDLSNILRTNNIERSYIKNNKHFYVGLQETDTNGIQFKSDGTRMYVLGDGGNDITEYSLSVPWEVGTAVPTGVVFSVSVQDTIPTDFQFKPDGTKLYVTGASNDRVYEYNLTTPWNISTLTYSTQFQLVNITYPSALDFSSDGSIMVILDRDGARDSIYEFTLTTPWSINTAIGPNNILFVGNQNTDPYGVSIDPTGTYLYVVGVSQNFIYQYELSTPFDLRTASYTGKTLGTNDSDTTNVFIKHDGTQIFTIGYGSDTIRSFNLSVPFDISTASASSTLLVGVGGVGETTPYGLWFKDDGSALYIVGGTQKIVYQYPLSTPWDISTAGTPSQYSVVGVTNTPTQIALSIDGDKLYIADHYNSSIIQYDLTSPWDITTVVTSSVKSYYYGGSGNDRLLSFTFSHDGSKIYYVDNYTTNTITQYDLLTAWDIETSQYNGAEIFTYHYETAPEGMKFSGDGSKLFIAGYTNDKIYQYNLSTPYDISTAAYAKDYYIGNEETVPRALTIGDNNTKIYISGSTSDIIWQYEVEDSETLDLDSLQLNDDSYNLLSEYLNPTETTPTGISFRPDGKRMFVSVTDNDRILQYELSTAWDVRTATRSKIWRMYDENFRTIETGIEGIYFRNDGRRLFVVGTTNDKVYSFELSEPWEITSISKALGEFRANNEETTPRSIHFSDDGIYMYILGETSDRVHQYTLSTPWDVTTATITRNLYIGIQLPTAYGVSFSGDGTRMYAIGASQDKIYEYILPIPWNISSYSFIRSFDIKTSHGLTAPRALYVRHDREEFYIVDTTTDRVHKFTIPSKSIEIGSKLKVFGDIISEQSVYVDGEVRATDAYFESIGIGKDANKNNQDLVSKRFAELPSIGIRPDISQLKIESDLFYYHVSGVVNNGYGIEFKPDGKTFYISNRAITGSVTCIAEYECDIPWDIRTASYKKFVNTSRIQTNAVSQSMRFSSDGLKLYVSYNESIETVSSIIEFKLNTAWDITSISNSGSNLITNKFGEVSESYEVKGFRFENDGSKLYIIKTNYIFEFTLSTPWDITTATKTFTLRNTEQYLTSDIVDIQFNSSGTKCFLLRGVLTETNYSLLQYNLKSSYDLSTCYYSGIAVELYGYNNICFTFKPDGKILYVISLSTNDVRQFKLSDAWDITTIQSPNFSGTITDTVESLRFVADGTKLVGQSGNNNYSVIYDLKEPYDIGSINRIENWRQYSERFVIGSIYDAPFFSPDGLKAYAAVYSGRSGTMELSLQNPYDFSTLRDTKHWLGQYHLSGSGDSQIISSALNDDGTKLYELRPGGEIYEHDLKIPYDLSSARRTDPKYYTLVGEPYAVGFTPDGKKMYVLNQTNGLIYEHETTDPDVTYDVRTMGYTGVTRTTVNTSNTRDFGFNNDGTKLYTLEVSSDSIHEITLTYPGNIRVSSGSTSYSFSGDGLTNPIGFHFKPDGTTLYVIDGTTDIVYQYGLSIPFAVDSISGLVASFAVSTEAPVAQRVHFSDDGYKMYVLNRNNAAPYSNNKVHQYELSIAWRVDTAVYNGNFANITNQAIDPTGFVLSLDGTRMFVTERSGDYVYQYELSTPWDITTALYETTTLNIRNTQGGAITNQARCLRFSPDGYTLFFTNYSNSNNNNILYQYDLQTPWKVSTASFTAQYIWNKNTVNNPYVRGYDINWDTGNIFTVDYGASASINTFIKYKLLNYENNKTEVFNGLQVYGTSHFNQPIEVEGKSEFYNIGIGTIGSEYSKLTVKGNSNLPYISSNELDLNNWYQGSDDSFWVGKIRDKTDYDSIPESVIFNDSGSRMYVLDRDNNNTTVIQFKLSSGWDISTAVKETGLDVSKKETIANGISFGNFGKEFYVVGESTDTVYQYSLSTAYDLSTAGFTTSFYVGGRETVPQSLSFNDDGSKLYIMGGADITEYSLSTPWNVSTASYVLESFNFSSITGDPREFHFKPDGAKVWIIGASADTIYEYNLTTPWDISTLTYVNKSLKILKTGETDPTGLHFSPDGKNLYFCGTVLDRVWRYRLSIPWDISTATIRKQSAYFINENEDFLSDMYDFDISSLGHKLYSISSGGRVYEYDLITPWKVESLSYTGRYYDTYSSDAYNASYSLKFSADGTKYYTTTSNTFKIAEYALTTPWDITTSVYTGALTTAGEHYNPESLEFNHDGTRLYIGGNFGVVWEYELLEPWSIVGARPASDSFALVEREGLSNNNNDYSFPLAVNFKPDGTKMYWIGYYQKKIFQVDLTDAWEVKSGVQVAEYRLSDQNNTTPQGFTFKPDGTQLYQTDGTNKIIYQYNLTTPWEIDSISGITTQLSTTVGVNINPRDIKFNNDGSKLYIPAGGSIFEYNLSVSWDVSTATYSGNVFTVPAETSPREIQFTEDGKTLYVSGDAYQRVIQFKLDVAWDLSSVRPWSATTNPVFDPTLYPENVITNDLNIFYSHYISPDGMRLYFINQHQYTMISNRVWQLELTTPYDITTARLNNRGFLSGYAFDTNQYLFTNVNGIAFNGSGSHLYLLDNARDRIHEFALTTPYKLDTAVATNRYINVNKEYFGEETSQGLVLKKDGTKLYFGGITKDMIWELDLPSQNIELTGNTIVHGDLEVQYKLDVNDVEANRVSVSDSITIGSNERSAYDTPLVVHGRADIRKIGSATNFDQFVKNHDALYTPENAQPFGVAFKPDGKMMYVAGSNPEELIQYSLSTPWNIKTATLVRERSLSGISADTRELVVKADGTQFYIIDLTPDKVIQLTASTPWDISTLTVTGEYTFTQDTAMTGLHIGVDGTSLYTVGYTNDRIYQYSLSTAWDVTTITYVNQLSIGSGFITPANTQPEGIWVSPDETKVYVTSAAEERIYEYTLSTPGDISTGTITTSFLLRQGSDTRGLTFNPNGREFYIGNTTPNKIFKYKLLEPFDLSTLQYPEGILDLQTDGNTNPYGFYIRPDGKKLYSIEYNDASQDIFEYDLATPWKINTGTLNQIVNLGDNYMDIAFKPDGTKMYLTNHNNATTSSVDEYTLSTPWDSSTAGLTTSFVTGGDDTQPHGLVIDPDGIRFWVCGNQNQYIYPYEMETPWDLRTARKVSEDFFVGSEETAPTSLAFGDNGNKLYILGDTGNDITQYNIEYGHEYDVRYASYSGITTGLGALDTSPQGLTFKGDGTKLWMAGDSTNTIYEYTLSTPWDVSTAGLTTSLLISSRTTTPTEIRFSDDGYNAYVLDRQNYGILQYSLATAWDISSATNVYRNFYFTTLIYNGASGVFGFDFGRDGTRLYISNGSGSSGNGLHRTYQFNLSEAWNIETAELVTSYKHHNSTNRTEYTPRGIVFTPDGTQFSVVGQNYDRVVTHKLSIPWEIESAYYDGVWIPYDTYNTVLLYGSQTLYFDFNSDGTKAYLLSYATDRLYEWDLKVPYRLYSGIPNYNFSYNLGGNDLVNVPLGLQISPDNEKFFICQNGTNDYKIYEYKLPQQNIKFELAAEFIDIESNIIKSNTIKSNFYYGDASNLTGISTSLITAVGIQSSGVDIGNGITHLNFVGVGNTFSVDGNTINIDIPGSTEIKSEVSNTNNLLTYSSSFGDITSLGATSEFIFNPSTKSLGIGTINPRANLDVTDSLLVSSGMGQTYDVVMRAYSDDFGSLSFESIDYVTQYFSITKDTSVTLFAINTSNYDPVFYVGANGLVGIGSTVPQTKLDVVGGDIKVGVNTSNGIILTSPNGTKYRLYVDDSGVLSTTAV